MTLFDSKQFTLFLVTGGVAATINFLSRIFYNKFTNFSLAIILAYITGMITAFILAKLFVFTETKQSLQHSILFFCLVNGLAILQTWFISILFAYYIFPILKMNLYPNEIAHAIGIIVPVFSSYLGHKHFSFKS